MSIASEQRRCPKCNGPISSEASQGLCPKCLLAEVSMPTEPGSTSKSRAPSLEELAAAFPHLEILELVGQGGMGFVFKARQPKLERFVALKILPQSLAADPAFSQRFSREGRVLARLNHPNIVTIHDFGQANGFFYLLMEFVDGVNLRQAMHAGRFNSAQALGIVPRICDALQYAHDEGVLHRDIKPENILLDTKGRVKLVDFGIGKMIGEAGAIGSQPSGVVSAEAPKAEPQLTQAGTALGTPQYMAPEQRERPDEVDHRADIYSLGVVFYELLTGELPMGKFASPSERSASDPRLDNVVRQALEKERDRRQQSAGEVRTQVESIAALTSSAPPVNPAGTSLWSRGLGLVYRSKARQSALLALGLFLAGTLGTLLLMTLSHRHEMALMFGGTALVLAFIFGVMSWRERLGKGIVVATLTLVVGLGVTVIILVGSYWWVGRRAAVEALHQKLKAKADQEQASQSHSQKPDAFVRIVAGTDDLTFEGERTTWEQLPDLLGKVSNRSNTVLELAIPDDMTMAQVAAFQQRAVALSQQLGFKYMSFVGVHPVGSKSSTSSSVLQFRLVANDADTNSPVEALNEVRSNITNELRVLPDVLMDGSAVKRAGIELQANGSRTIGVELTEEGSRRFGSITASNVNRQIAIVAKGRVLSAPIIRTPIRSGDLKIDGGMNAAEVHQIVAALNRTSLAKTFSAPVELLLPRESLLVNSVCLDLDSSNVFTNDSRPPDQDSTHDWVRGKGGDIMSFGSVDDSPILNAFDLKAIEAPQDGWNSVLPADVVWNWTLTRPNLVQDALLGTARGLPNTFLFRTRENGFGILQILDATNPAPNVKVRYKLVQDSKPEAPRNASTPVTAQNHLEYTNVLTANTMRALATRICEKDDAAFGELRLIATELFRNLDYAKEQERLLRNVILMRAAFNELGEQAGRSNAHALAALQTAAFSRPLKAHVPHALGIAAAAGNEHALDMLLHHQDWNILLSSTVFALRAPAEKNNGRAIEFLIAVLENPKHRALWDGASNGLRTAAANGNAKARAAVEKYEKAKPKSDRKLP